MKVILLPTRSCMEFSLFCGAESIPGRNSKMIANSVHLAPTIFFLSFLNSHLENYRTFFPTPTRCAWTQNTDPHQNPRIYLDADWGHQWLWWPLSPGWGLPGSQDSQAPNLFIFLDAVASLALTYINGVIMKTLNKKLLWPTFSWVGVNCAQSCSPQSCIIFRAFTRLFAESFSISY